MIVRVFKTHPAGTGRPLTTYVLAAKHERAGNRLGSYIRDPTKDKVAWDRTVNCEVDDPFQAIGAIERYNARNTRTHRKSRWEHIVVSFPDGERPTRQRMEIIEDRLMAAIGFGDHPRISAVHHDTLHSHLHIAVSRIDPTTLHAEHPRLSRFRLQAEAARLEIELGLRQEPKTLQLRDRQELEARRSLDRAVDAHHSRLERDDASPDLEREMRGYFDALGRRGAEMAAAAGVTREAIMNGLVGVARIRPMGELWEPDENGTVAFVTPVRVHPGNTAHDIESTDPARSVRSGDIVDLIAWHPSRPDTWVLRTGAAAALGAVQYRLSDEAPEALQVHDSPLAWLRAGGTGIVVLNSSVDRRLILGIGKQTKARQVNLEGLAELDRRAPMEPRDRQSVEQAARSTITADAPFQREALEKASWADKVQSGLRPLMVEDVARMIEPQYAALIKRAALLRDQAAKEERSRHAMELNKLAAAYRVAERRAEIGVLGRAAHFIGTVVPALNILRNLELHRWERMQGGAAYMEDNKGIKQGAAEGELTKVSRLAAQMLDPDHPIGRELRPSGLTLRQEAKRELQRRQEIARNAREILVNAQRATITRRRGHTLRSGP